MLLKDLAEIICERDTAEELLKVVVATIDEPNKVLWTGKAKDLKTASPDKVKDILKWSVCEVKRIPESDKTTPIYNKSIKITIY